MKFRLNLITLALVGLSGNAVAGFNLNDANTDNVNFDKWQCKKCDTAQGYRGQVGVGIGYADTNDSHAANAFAGNEDDYVGHLNADVRYNNESGYAADFESVRLGTGNGWASATAGKAGLAEVGFDYQTLTHWTNDFAVTSVARIGDDYNTGTIGASDIKSERERYGFHADIGGDWWETYGRFQREERTGNTASSISRGFVSANIIKPIDSTTDQWEAGARVKGGNWHLGAAYMVSDYDNNEPKSYALNSNPYALSTEPDNSIEQVMVDGQYILPKVQLAGRVAMGELRNDSTLIAIGDIGHFDGKVDTTDANLRISGTPVNRLRMIASVDYSDRDNDSELFQGKQVGVRAISGDITEYEQYDITKTLYKLTGSYRITQGYRFDLGLERKETERTGVEREENDDNAVWAKLKVTALDNWGFSLKGGYSDRDGSSYEANRGSSSEDNDLLRRYYIDDRERVEGELRISHTPTNAFALDLTARYAKDDYDAPEFGLQEAEDYSYDLTANYRPTKQLNLHAFVGQQWINAEQNSIYTVGQSFDETEDRFVNAGFGTKYQGLFVDALSVGADYVYSDSDSNVDVTVATTADQGDYFATSHSVNLYGDYALNDRMGLRLDYLYERFESTDYGNVDPFAVDGLTTIANLDHNYNAHMVLLTFSYNL